jgi:DNA helicase II / ATP-dependent DNA helicase PcrA
VLLAGLRRRWDHILVDEFQDVDEVQYEWMRLLAGGDPGPESPRLWAVGDPDQSVYGFRGGSPEFIRRVPRDFPGTAVYGLTRSYRCPDNVLRASTMILPEGPGSGAGSGSEEGSGSGEGYGGAGSKKTAPPSSFENESGIGADPRSRRAVAGTAENVKVRIVGASTDASEAEYVARTIEAMTGGVRFFSMDSGITSGADEDPFGFSDFAVLCRVGRQFPAFEKAFRDHGIPFRQSDTEPFYRREPVRSIVRALKSSGSNLAGNVTVRRLIEIAAESVREASHPEHRPYVELLAGLSDSHGTDLAGFLTALDLGTGLDWVRPDIEAVALTTLHAAKGLEFSCVFIPGVEDGLLPYTLFRGDAADPEEERRLLYVGMTRAVRRLILTHAAKRTLFGRPWSLPASPFLDDIEASLLKTERARGPAGRPGARTQMDLF